MRGNKMKSSSLRKWTISAALLLVVSAALLIALLLVGQGTKQPVEWSQSMDRLNSGVALEHDAGVIVGSKNNQIIRLDKEGKTVWTTASEGSVMGLDLSPDGSKLVAATEDRQMIILNTESGKEAGRIQIPYPAVTVKWGKDGNLIVSAGLAQKNRVYGYSEAGEKLWTFESNVPVRALADAEDGSIFLGTDNSRVYLVGKDGKKQWEYVAKSPIYGLVADQGKLFFADQSGLYGEINKQGKQVWRAQLSARVAGMTAAPSSDNLIIASNTGSLFSVSRDGKLKGEMSVEGLTASNAVAGLRVSQTGENIIVFGDKAVSVNAAALSSLGSGALADVLTIAFVVATVMFAIALLLRILLAIPRIRAKVEETIRLAWKNKIAYILLIPTVLLLVLFNYYPTLSAFYHSFTDWRPGRYTEFIGFSNFEKVWESHYFWIGIKNLIILVVTQFIKLAFPLVVAVIVFHLVSEKSRYWMRNLFVFPIIVPGIVGVLIWQFIYDPNYGLLNNALIAIGLESWTHAWLGETGVALTSIIFIGVPWVGPFAFLVFYGGLIGIPQEVYEAGKLDGITKVKRFFSIELPLLTAQIRLLLILTFIGTMQDFSTMYLTTQGGPLDSTYVPALELYYSASKFSDYGYASALGVVLFAVILLGTIFQMRLRSSVEYDSN